MTDTIDKLLCLHLLLIKKIQIIQNSDLSGCVDIWLTKLRIKREKVAFVVDCLVWY